MFIDPADDPRDDGPTLGDERTTLVEFLRCQRATLARPSRLWRRRLRLDHLDLVGRRRVTFTATPKSYSSRVVSTVICVRVARASLGALTVAA
jgi:hypothetical protein